MAKDPICGMDVDEKNAEFMVHLQHETFYFCCERCKEAFEKERGLLKSDEKIWKRFLTWLARGGGKAFGGKPPKCH